MNEQNILNNELRSELNNELRSEIIKRQLSERIKNTLKVLSSYKKSNDKEKRCKNCVNCSAKQRWFYRYYTCNIIVFNSGKNTNIKTNYVCNKFEVK
jgi:hypothetical protein